MKKLYKYEIYCGLPFTYDEGIDIKRGVAVCQFVQQIFGDCSIQLQHGCWGGFIEWGMKIEITGEENLRLEDFKDQIERLKSRYMQEEVLFLKSSVSGEFV